MKNSASIKIPLEDYNIALEEITYPVCAVLSAYFVIGIFYRWDRILGRA
jgi:hypothetical protein